MTIDKGQSNFGIRRSSMTHSVPKLILAGAAGLIVLFANDSSSSSGRSLVSQADARVGRPLTPVSVAGVHRRAARRADRRDYYYGAGAGVAAAGAVAAGAVAAGAATTGVAPAAVAPGPYPSAGPSDAVDVEPGLGATVTDPATGRRCTISTTGYHWCWTP